MDIKTAFRFGFLKKAAALGFSHEQAAGMYAAGLQKIAYNDLPISTDEVSDFKNQMQDQGYAPPTAGSDYSPQAVGYNHHMIQQRDQLAAKNPDIETALGGLSGGAYGAAAGTFGGHLAGHLQKSTLDPAKFSPRFMQKLPGRFRVGGALIGALAGGIPGAMNARHKVDVAKKLEDPRNLDYFIRQMANERHLANNDFNNYAQ